MLIRRARATDASAIARVHIESWKTTYRGIVSDDFLNNMSYEDQRDRWVNILKKNKVVFVAEDPSGKIVGFASGGPERNNHSIYKGELYAIYILKHYQGKGIGKQLVRAVTLELERSGLSSMLVWVLENNPSKHFYESLGGKFVAKQPIEIGEQTLEEIAYGWENLNELNIR